MANEAAVSDIPEMHTPVHPKYSQAKLERNVPSAPPMKNVVMNMVFILLDADGSSLNSVDWLLSCMNCEPMSMSIIPSISAT